MINTNTSFDIQNLLGDGGMLSRNFTGFESRPQQIKMTLAVQKAFKQSRHLAVEAGTGVGKSFAYLIPAIDMLGNGADKVLISTFTITLQEQLVNKDLPFLADNLDKSFTAVLAKGRGNYLCTRRLKFAMRKGKLLFDNNADQLSEIAQWASQTTDGSLSDLPFVPKSSVWDLVKSEHGNCPGRRCECFADCFYRRARRRLDSADIIVANHALMFSDLVFKEQGVSLLGDYQYVIVDEAHNIERVAENHFGIDISNWRIKLLLNSIYNPTTRRGLLAYTKAEKAIDIVCCAARESEKFFKKVIRWYEKTRDKTGGRYYKNFIEDNISGHLKKLRRELSDMANTTEDVDGKFEIIRMANKCAELIKDLKCFLEQALADHVYWVEVGGGRRSFSRLRSAPVNVGTDVKRCLFDRHKSVILTSATLSSGDCKTKEGFEFFASRIGLSDFDAVKLGSPFDYKKQVTTYIEKDLPEPNNKEFVEIIPGIIESYILQSGGRAFVLFTSYQMLNKVAGSMSPWLRENNIELLQQGTGLDRTMLLEQFKKDSRSVLFGADSFWQGVDVRGQALSNVIIVRLPFAVPDHPLLAGRLEQITEQGGDPFFDYQLPSAIIKFKQGFGRLIRSKSDTGIVVVLDSRIIRKGYGKRFLAAIPQSRIKIVAHNLSSKATNREKSG